MGNYFTNPIYSPEDEGVQEIRRTIDIGAFLAAPSNVVPIGAVAKGASVVAAFAIVETAFNGTTPAITLGSSGTAAGIMASADIAPAATGLKAAPASGALMGIPMTADTVIQAKLTQTNTTAGKLTLVCQISQPRNVSDGIRNNPNTLQL